MKRINKQSIAKSFLFCLSWLITTLSSSQSAAGQSTSENYILKRSYTDTQGRYTTTIQYFDGLGRPYRQVQKDAVSAGVDLVVATEYDSQGRDSLTWLLVKGRDGLPLTADEIRTQAAALYNGDSRPYSVSLYEPSALNRISKSFGPGQAWAAAGRASETAYMSNSATETRLVCRKYMAKDEKTLEKKGHYPAASLYVTEAKDEDGHTVLTFKNTIGQVLLTRTFPQANGAPADTYYVYDSHGMLCWVLPPAASDLLTFDGTWSWNDADISNYVYYYCYDGRQQLIIKKLPGAERTEIIYDLAGRVVLIEDGNLRAKRRMQYFYYDVFGNVREMGLCSLLPHQLVDYYRTYISQNRFAVQGPTASSYMEERKGLNVIENVTPLQYYWYDTYDFLSSPGFAGNTHFTASSENAKGKLTGSEATVFGSSDVIRTVYHYDRKGRLSKTTSNNLVGGYDTETLTYTFTNQIKTKERVHTSSRLASPLTELYTFTYDDWGKLLTTTHKLNNNPAVTLASYTYDALGRNIKKAVNNGNYTSTYSYNIRSWLEKIEGTKFIQQLYYNTGVGTPCYNSNISSMTWKAGGETTLRGYKFSYDGLNRLISSVYDEGGSLASNVNRYTENMTYDKMGNMLSVKRYGKLTPSTFGVIDDLSLTYSGNQLQKVTDAVTAPITAPAIMHFVDSANSNTEYTYDSNGNLLSDLNKNIIKIEYNVLNLPQKVTFSNGDWIGYVYDGAGNKRRVSHHIGQTISVTDYTGGMIYENGVLSKILTENGYVSFSDATPVYHYYLNDHLGNNRVVMDAAGTIEQVNHYYPFGGIIAESNGQDAQAWKFNGKELDKTGGLDSYDFGARQYDPLLSKWMAYDPFAEKNYSWSPYAYCFNNPVNYIDPDGRDGMRIGSGTEEDPYVIIANYYYKNGSLDDDVINGLNEAILKYNNNGNARKMNIDGKKSYVVFQLKAEGVDDVNQAIEENNFSMIDGKDISYGNKVSEGANPDEVSGDDYGSANSREVSINMLQVEKGVSEGRSSKKTITGTFIHEIGHNLGLDHGDKTNIMAQMNGVEFQNSIFGNSSAGANGSQPVRSFSYPKVDSKGIKIMLQRVNAPRSKGLGIIKTR